MKLHKNKSDSGTILNQSAKKSAKKLTLHCSNIIIMTTKTLDNLRHCIVAVYN